MVCNKTAAILLVGLLQGFVIFKKQLEELKTVSYIFIVIVFFFICLLFSELMTDGEFVADTINFDELTRVKSDYHLITAVSIMVFAYNIQFMVFPTYAELEKRTTVRYWWSSLWATVIYTASFAAVGLFALLLFGSELKPDFLVNMATRSGNVSIAIRATYCFVLLFHIPYYSFAIREYVLVIYDELNNRSLSTHLESKLEEFYKNKNQAP